MGNVRPITSKMLESLTGIVSPRLPGAVVLDLFAGSGRIGMHFASHGAERVVLVEGHREVARALRSAVREHQEKDRLSVVVGAVPKVLGRLRGTFDLVVCDPPYDWSDSEAIFLGLLDLVVAGGWLVVEHHHKTTYSAIDGWQEVRVEKFGESRLSFFERV